MWTDEKQGWEESEKRREQKRRREEERRSAKRRSQKKEDLGARKGVFPMICGPGGSKSRLAKAAGAEPSGQMRDQKLHAAVARSKFASEKVKGTSRLRCWKSAWCCGAKQISKSKVEKTDGFGPLLDVQISLRVAGARDCAACQKWEKREGFVAVSTTTTTTLHSTTLQLQLQLHDATLHFITLHYNYNDNYISVTLRYAHYITLHYTKYITLRYTPLHYTTLHYTNWTALQLQLQLQLHCTALHCTTLTTTTTTTTAAPNHTTSSSCGWGDRPGDHCNHCNHFIKHNSNHLSVHQWIRSAIRDSQQPSSPIGFLFLKLPPPPCAVLLVYNDYQWLI